ncbi:DUF222 domain-containing protein [Rhodococcus spelaei]|uniref:DUF222 domain-containing protein n=1 Tax=Rhodococcus spelaei TaxID=2546320 RepID=A0A541B294_9NOCA|nr:HNH endonuclease signature motif containing protein [Rhodococcus spelaei]TQF66436.1 DUF222 domain-containing protein [Rhodococcus spelaei]
MFSNRVDAGRVSEHLTALDAAVETLLTDRLTGLSNDDVVEALQRIETSMRTLAAADQRVIVESAERSLPGSFDITPVEFLVKTVRISEGDATVRLRAAKRTGTWHSFHGEEQSPDYPHTAQAFRDGAIGWAHVEAVRDVMRQIPSHIDATKVEAAEQILALLARHADPKYVTRAGLDLLAYLNPDGDYTESDRKRQRGLRIGRQRADLMTPISGMLDPETRALLEPLLAKMARPGMNNPDDPASPSGTCESERVDRDALAHAAARDTRTTAQRNHDAFKVGLRHLLGSGVLGRHRGLPVTAIITMTLQQLEQASGVVTTASGGIVPVSDALRLAERANPVLVLFDHNGRPLHLGREKRLASADQRLALIAASRGCTRPGCDAPASMTAVHHVRDWVTGGRTDIDSEDLACDHCHALIHDGPGGWKTEVAPSDSEYAGRTLWIPPAHIDPTRTPRVNHRHHLDELFGILHGIITAREESELREWRAKWDPTFSGYRSSGHNDRDSHGSDTDGDVP